MRTQRGEETVSAFFSLREASHSLTFVALGRTPCSLTIEELAWHVGSPLVKVTVDGERQVLQFLGESGEVRWIALASHPRKFGFARRERGTHDAFFASCIFLAT